MEKFGKLRLSVQGTNNGSGFDIFYNFGKSLNFVEFESKPEFYFVQPWMQFPSKEYTDECMRVSIELVRRFNEFEENKQKLEAAEKNTEFLLAKRDLWAWKYNEFLHQILPILKQVAILDHCDETGRIVPCSENEIINAALEARLLIAKIKKELI